MKDKIAIDDCVKYKDVYSLYFHHKNGIEWGKIPWELAIKIARNEGLVR